MIEDIVIKISKSNIISDKLILNILEKNKSNDYFTLSRF